MTTPPPKRTLAFVADAVFPFNKGGKETRLFEITRHLARAGHDVHIFTMNWWGGEPTIQLEGVWYHAICRYRPLYAGTRRSTKQALVFGLATLRLLTHGFDALDVDHMPVFPVFSAKVVCALRRKPLYATWHEVWGKDYWLKYLGPPGIVGYLSESLSYRMPRVIIANSDHTAERLAVSGMSSPVRTVPLGVDFSGVDRVGPSGQTSDLIYAGRLLAHKNVHLVIEAVARLRQERPSIRCLIIGEGPERYALERLAEQLGVSRNVTFADFVPRHEDLFALIKSSKVFVLPSEREGFGAVVLEANACDVPVVTVSHPDNAAQRLIVGGENGFVVPGNAESIASAVARCLESSQLAPRHTLERRNLAADWSAVAQRIGEIVTSHLDSELAAA